MKTMMMKTFYVTLMVMFFTGSMFAQIGINNDGADPDNSAILDVKSTSKGLLIPRMTQTQLLAIASPADGLQVYCTTDSKLYIFVAAANLWKEVAYGTGTMFTCGSSITFNHVVSGGVAPVNKTVTYGTVTGILGAPSKCWISSNLGSDHQATAVNDATEASAGWYWQFNRKQGYKHAGGANRTPNTTWITSINENLDWQAANDPCALELGSGWRIPTLTEWYNVDLNGGWVDWNGPWTSALKLHAAGHISPVHPGDIEERGNFGFYWASNQFSTTNGWYEALYSGGALTGNDSKAWGLSIRCLKD